MKFLNLVPTPGDRPDYFVYDACRTEGGCSMWGYPCNRKPGCKDMCLTF